MDGKNGLLWETKADLYEKTLELTRNKEYWQKLSEAAIKNSKRFRLINFFN